MSDDRPETASTDIAIVGLALRLPGAADADTFWERIRAGEELLTTFTDEELRAAGVAEELLRDPAYIKVSGLVEDSGDFDAEYFGIAPSEARLMDPQHRLFLELCWHALEDSGYDPDRYPGDIAVFAGGGRHAYLRYIEPNFDHADYLDGSIRGLQADIGNYGDFLATRVSYRLGLTGPSLNVQTACSTALVGVHLAVQSLLLGETDLALAGAVNVHTPQVNGYIFEEGSICSPDGHLRPFDADASGSVFGNGGGVVALKRLDDALAANDRIIAVVKGSAINNDGAEKMSFTAPSIAGQADVVARAQRVAQVDPRTIGYVEAHGTGTALGDPIEVAALISAFDVHDAPAPYCALGAVKAQIGHLGPAAGIAGLIKAALVLERGQIPPVVNFEKPNPDIAFDGSPFYVPTELTEWEGTRRAGVSAFGVGGTNAHVVLEQAPERTDSEPGQARPTPVVLSAGSPQALDRLRGSLAARLRRSPELDLGEVARVLATGRRRSRHRLAVTATGTAEAAALLTAPQPAASPAPESELPVVFAFPGQGAQYVDAGRELYRTDAVFRDTVDELSERLVDTDGLDVRTVLFPEEDDRPEAAVLLRQALYAQPALFITEYALATALIAAGVEPDVMIGHSIGEYAAAALAGVLTPHDALKLVAARGRLMHTGTEPGAMMAVGLPEAELRRILPPDLDIAAVNAPEQTVVSGSVEAIARFDDQLADTDLLHTVLGTSLAAHSSLMEPIVEEFRTVAHSVAYRPATRPLASTLLGTMAGPETMADPEYWVRHLRQAVRFLDGARAVLALGPALIVESGPGRALGGMFRQADTAAEVPAVTPWVQKERAAEPKSTAELVGAIWTRGGRVDWERQLIGRSTRRVALPGYPFDRATYWTELPAGSGAPVLPSSPLPLRRRGLVQRPRWVATPLDPGTGEAPVARRVLALLPDADHPVLAALRADGHTAVALDPAALDPAALPPAGPAGDGDTAALLDALEREHGEFDTVLQVAKDRPAGAEPALRELVDDALAEGFWPVLRTVRALAARRRSGLDVLIATTGARQLTAEERPRPELALLAGPARVLPQEYPGIRVTEVDLDPAATPENAASLLAAELRHPATTGPVAHRGTERRTLRYEPADTATHGTPWEPGGRYLVTGGLGGIGLALAEEAARHAPGVTLVLTHRAELPSPQEARLLLADDATPAAVRSRLEGLARLEAAGARVHTVRADAADRDAMSALRSEHGPFTGIVHAAGVAGGRLIDTVDAEHVARVLAPKATGTLVLDEVVADEHTRWLVLCSSVSSVVGGIGHVDYCSANAFLDSFAQWRDASGRRTLSLGYDAWTDVGMAVDEARRSLSERSTAVDHPVFSTQWESEDVAEYRGELRAGTDWMVDEHHVAGHPMLPGTGIVEFVRAAAERRLGVPAVEIRELDLLRPLPVPPGGVTEFTVRLEGRRDELKATLLSRRDGSAWREHATGLVGPAGAPEPAPAPIVLPAADTPDDIPPGNPLTSFGPRWANVRRSVRTGPDELVLEAELPAAYHGDLGRHGVHPALLDTAAGSLLGHVSDRPHLPMSYERITVHRPMPARIRSHIVRRSTGADSAILFDVRIQDEHGDPVLELAGYSLRAVDPDELAGSLAAPGSAANHSLVSTDIGDLEALRLVESERTEPGPGEVRVEVLATGLNFKEVLIATGMLDPGNPDFRFGLECAGVVRAVGAGVTGLRVGDPVLAMGSGCFSDQVVVRAALTAPIPAGLTYAQAASVPVAFTTAYDCLHNLAGLRAGERVLVHAVTGGVGLAAVQLARHLGAEVFGTAGSQAKREFALAQGVGTVMDSRSLAFERETLAAGGVDVVLNSLAGDFIPAGLRTLRERGRFVELGRRDIVAGSLLDLGLFSTGRTFSAYYPEDETALDQAFAEVAALLRGGVLQPLPVRAFDLADVREAFTHMSRAQHIGKVVVCRPGAHDQAVPAAESAAEGITAATGTAAFHSALATGGAHLLASARSFAPDGDDLVVAGHVLQGADSSTAHTRPELGYDFAPLEGETEQRLGPIWAGVLSIEAVGREDQFLDLGGDSLYATQVVARIRAEFGVRIAPANVLGDVPLRALARLIDDELGREVSGA
ncbi:beta-ketoacyl synthase N-terminal-like domain-containing protein [Kitasatospora sp. NPDC057015]|uniref:beta-ketoacyl synthase N-terminal-like domain-containing protein n=1 Tax=Kitasatospora sp. NPDC057015 TaxID=3346001 RepID=UPI00362C525F